MGYGGDVSGFASLKVTVEVAQLIKWCEGKISRTNERIKDREEELEKLVKNPELMKAVLQSRGRNNTYASSNARGPVELGGHELAKVEVLAERINSLKMTRSGLTNTLIGLKAHQGLKTMEIPLQLVQSLSPEDTFTEDLEE